MSEPIGYGPNDLAMPPEEDDTPECLFDEDPQEPGDCVHCGNGFAAPTHRPRSTGQGDE